MAPRFGTDGLRGVANSELTPELALRLGRVAARHLHGDAFVIGCDTRESSPMLRAALAAGIAAEGVDVIDVGVLPTPGVAYLAASRNCPGAIISASHNPFYDNGIKLVSAQGSKIDDETERAIEAELDALAESAASVVVPDVLVSPKLQSGNITINHQIIGDYIEHLLGAISLPEDCALSVVLDCANGAASFVAPKVFERLPVKTTVICNEPNGTNINDNCGSTHPERIVEEVLAQGADLGLCFDGDADRLIAVAHDGTVVDGDRLIAMFALDLHERNELDNGGVVITVMSNLGLHQRLTRAAITVAETPVGDRYVADALSENNFVLGGEQSGHIIFARDATTGDGMLTGLKLMELLARSGRSLRELSDQAMVRLPQELRTIHVPSPERLDDATVIWEAVQVFSEELGSDGRVLLRRSGTEAAVRVMVEAQTHDQALSIVTTLEALIIAELR